MGDIIVTLRFTDIREARRGLGMLKLLDSEGQLRVRAAALVERAGDGRIGRAIALEEISQDRESGVALVIAEVEDPDPDVLASALDAVGGSASQRPAGALSGARARVRRP